MTEKTPRLPRWSQAFSHAELHPSEFQNYIGVSTRAMAAGYAIILFETAANPEAIWELTPDCITENADTAMAKIHFIKRRAGKTNELKEQWIPISKDAPKQAMDVSTYDVIKHQIELQVKVHSTDR